MANLFIFIPKSAPYEDTGVDPAEVYEDGQIHRFDSTDSVELAAANRIIADGAGFDVSELVSALIQISWNNITGKPSTFTPSAHEHSADDVTSGTFDDARIAESNVTQHQSALALAIAQIAGLQAALDAKLESTLKGAANGLAELDGDTLVPLAQLPSLPASQVGSGTFDVARIPDLDWSKILSATRPTTLAGYGITDALTSTQIGTQIQSAIDALLDGAPSALDTLNELAAAIGDDADAIGTLTAAIATKLDASVWVAATASNDGYMTQEQAGKLAGIESGATADQTGAEIKAAYEGEADTNAYTDAEKAKLAAIEAEATKNATDAQLRDRSTHTGTQAISTVTGLQDALNDKVELADLPFASIAEYTSTDTSTDLADAGGAVIQWDTSRQTDSAVIIGGTNDTEISFGENGKYRVAVRLAYEDTSAEDTDVNNSVGLFFKLNGTGTGGQGIGSTVINTAGANEGQVWFEQVISISDYENQVVTVCTQRLSGADELYLRSGESTLIIEKVGGKSALLAAQSISDIDGLQDELDTKADAADVYTQAEVDALLDDKLDADAGPLTYQGAWNASTNTPTIPAAASANKGHVYIVSVAGSTDIDGDTDWKVKDWIVSNGTTWGKIDNTEPDVDAAIDARIGTEEGDLAALGEGGKFSASLLPEGFGGGLQGEHVTGSGNLTADTSTTVDAQGALAIRALPSLSAGDGFIVHAYNGFVEIDLGSGVTASGFDQGGNPLIKPNETVFLQAISSTHLVRMFQLGSFGSVGLLEIEAAASVGDADTAFAGYVQTVDVPAVSSVTLTDAPLSGYVQTVDMAAVAAVGDVTELQAAYRQSAEVSAVAEIPEAEAVLAAYRQSAAVSAVAEASATQRAHYIQSVSAQAVASIEIGSPLHPIASSYINAMVTPPSGARVALINDLIVGAAEEGILAKLDRLSIIAHTEQASLLDVVNPAISMTAVNSPTFTADTQFAGNGSTSYINTHFNPAVHGVQYTQNSASVGVRVKTSGAGNQSYGFSQRIGPNQLNRVSENTSSQFTLYSLNGTTNGTQAVAESYPATLALNRSSSTEAQAYKDGVLVGDLDEASSSPLSVEMYLLAYNNNGTPNGQTSGAISAWWAGASLSAGEHAAFVALIAAYEAGLSA